MSEDALDLDALAELHESHGTEYDGDGAAAWMACAEKAHEALPALIAAARDRDRIVGVVSEWMREFGPESRWERSVGPQVVSVGHVYATIVDDDPHPPHSSWPEYAGSLTAVTAERDAARAELAALRAALTRAIEELVECRSFISVETRHYPTVTGISAKIQTLRAALTTGADQ